MAITVSVTGNTPEELKGHLLWLSERLGAIDLVKDLVASKVADKVTEAAVDQVVDAVKAATDADKVVKAARKKADKTVDPENVAPPATASPPPPTESNEGSADLRVEIQQIANRKSTQLGSAKVKEVIAAFGATYSRDVPDDKLPALKAALEALA